jgi:DNA (cytosine-5)-methyltransferase 1
MINAGTVADSENLKKWLGIKYDGNIYYKNHHCPSQVLRNCVHPDLGLHVLNESKRTGLFLL